MLEPPRREAIEKIRDMIFQVFPGIEEDMVYKMPTYHLDGNALCAVASQKHYLAFYLMPHDFLPKFKERLKNYNCGKSCIRFKHLTPDTLKLLEEIVTFSGKNYADSSLFGKRNPKA